MISLSKKFCCFRYHFWRLSSFFVVLQISSARVSKHQYTCLEKRNWEKITFKTVFLSISDIGQKKTWNYSKTVKHDFQNCSLRVQRKKFRIFSEARLIVWKFSVFERKDGSSCEMFYSGLPMVHFRCPVQHFGKKMTKVNFTFCG